MMLAALAGLALAGVRPALGASVMIWPIDPVIEQDRDATALWLENHGTSPAVMQTRIVSWTQVDGEDRLTEQTAIIASPPIARIPPGGRQLIRIIAERGPRSGEMPYRIMIDEIPQRPAPPVAPPVAASGESAAPAAPGGSMPGGPAVVFRMRYSIPLFIYGAQALRKDSPPPLTCSVIREGERRYLRFTNPGTIHARLTDVAFQQGGKVIPVASGLLGYVLPGSTLHRALPDGVTGREPLTMKINDRPEPVTIPQCDGP